MDYFNSRLNTDLRDAAICAATSLDGYFLPSVRNYYVSQCLAYDLETIGTDPLKWNLRYHPARYQVLQKE